MFIQKANYSRKNVFFLLIFIWGIILLSGCKSENKLKTETDENVTIETAKNYESQKDTLKIYHIMSNHSPWEWTDSMLEGFKKPLSEYNIEYKVFQIDGKRHSDEEWKLEKAKEAKAELDKWKPDLVFTTDDDAQKYIVKDYINTDLPFVFAGVNSDPGDYGFTGSENITGVMEIEHFPESVKLLKEVVPNIDKIGVVIDNSPMWVNVVERMKEKQKQFSDIEFIYRDPILTFDEFKTVMEDYESNVDAVALLGIFNFKDNNNKNVPYQDVLQWVSENINIPDFSYWKDRAFYGTLCVASVSGYEQGYAAGEMAKKILIEGISPSKIEMKPTTKGEFYINVKRAKLLKVDVSSNTLLTANGVNTFEWEK